MTTRAFIGRPSALVVFGAWLALISACATEKRVCSVPGQHDEATVQAGAAQPIGAHRNPFPLYSSFQLEVAKDLLQPWSARYKTRKASTDYFLADRPRLLAAISVNEAFVRRTGTESLDGRQPVEVMGALTLPMPGYPTGMLLKGRAFVVRRGGDQRYTEQVEAVMNAVRKGTAYRPPTFASRVAPRVDQREKDPSKVPLRTCWYAWMHPDLTFPLLCVGFGSSEAREIEAFSTDEWLLEQPEQLRVEISSSNELTSENISDIADLMWWQAGNYIGVSSSRDSRCILYLLPGTRFSNLGTLFHVKSVSEVTMQIKVEVAGVRNPFARE